MNHSSLRQFITRSNIINDSQPSVLLVGCFVDGMGMRTWCVKQSFFAILLTVRSVSYISLWSGQLRYKCGFPFFPATLSRWYFLYCLKKSANVFWYDYSSFYCYYYYWPLSSLSLFFFLGIFVLLLTTLFT